MKTLFVIGPLQIQSTGQNSQLTSNVAMFAFKKSSTPPPLKLTKTMPSFRKLNSPATKLGMLFLHRELWPQTYSLSLPFDWSQVTHIPASTKMGVAYKALSYPSTVPLQDKCAPVFQDGSRSFQHAHKHYAHSSQLYTDK